MLELIIFIVSIILVVLYIIMWIRSMAEQLKKKRYYWFIFTMIFSPSWIVYWIYTRLLK